MLSNYSNTLLYFKAIKQQTISAHLFLSITFQMILPLDRLPLVREYDRFSLWYLNVQLLYLGYVGIIAQREVNLHSLKPVLSVL